jgi:hypothetical protein
MQPMSLWAALWLAATFRIRNMLLPPVLASEQVNEAHRTVASAGSTCMSVR